jgi:hypothetical protein
MPPSREQTSVTFRIQSATLTAADIAARTGLTADETWKLGEPRGRFGNIEKKNGFVMESKLMSGASIDEHVKGMLKRLAPAAQKVGALTAECSIEFVCTVHRKVAPMLRFERDDLRWLGVMGARLDVDIFVLNDGGAAKAQAKPESAPGTPPPPTNPSGSGMA